jgi:hypothetical protein
MDDADTTKLFMTIAEAERDKPGTAFRIWCRLGFELIVQGDKTMGDLAAELPEMDRQARVAVDMGLTGDHWGKIE